MCYKAELSLALTLCILFFFSKKYEKYLDFVSLIDTWVAQVVKLFFSWKERAHLFQVILWLRMNFGWDWGIKSHGDNLFPPEYSKARRFKLSNCFMITLGGLWHHLASQLKLIKITIASISKQKFFLKFWLCNVMSNNRQSQQIILFHLQNNWYCYSTIV